MGQAIGRQAVRVDLDGHSAESHPSTRRAVFRAAGGDERPFVRGCHARSACGMAVEGITYCFCCPECAREFENEFRCIHRLGGRSCESHVGV